MSEEKNLNDRLDNLFSELESQASTLTPKKLPIEGWTWEADQDGIITECSPDIEEILGISNEAIIGQDIFTHRLVSKSKDNLKSRLEENIFPIEVDLKYIHKNGDVVQIRTSIFPVESINDKNRGWRGINRVLQEGDTGISDLNTLPQVKDLDETPSQTKPSSALPSFGVGIDGTQIFTIDKPTTSIGVVSLQDLSTHVENATVDSPASIAVPISLQQDSVGLLEIIDDSPSRIWSKNEQRLVEQVADQLGLALENARLFQETQISLSRTEALYSVGQAAIGFENLEELLNAVVDTIAKVVPADRALIAVIDEQKGILTHYFENGGLTHDTTPQAYSDFMNGLSGWCIKERKPAFSPKGEPDLRISQDIQKISKNSEAGSTIIVPMTYRERNFGTITIINRVDQPDFNQGDLDLIAAMATQVATALDNARLFNEEQRRRHIADTLSETARVVGATLELKDVGDRLLSQLSEVIEFDLATLIISEGNQFQKVNSLSKHGYSQALGLETEKSIINSLLDSHKPLLIKDTRSNPLWLDNDGNEKIQSFLGAPLLSGDEILGFLFVHHRNPGIYNEETVDILSAIAAQVSVAIRNANLFQQIQRRSIQLQTAAEISRAATSTLETNPLIQQTVNLIRDRFNLYYVGLFLLDERREWAVLHAGTGEAGRIQIERGHRLQVNNQSMIGNCIQTSQPQTPEELTTEISRFINPLLPDTKTEIALPLISRGQVIGAVSIQSNQENAFTQDDVAILQTMSDQVANALQNAYLFSQTQARAEELTILNEMSQSLSRDLDIHAIIRNIYLFATRLIDTSTFYVALHDKETDEISFPFSTENNRQVSIPERPFSNGLPEYIIKNQETALIKDDAKIWFENHGIDIQHQVYLPESWLAVPLAIGDETLGIMCVQHDTPYHFTEQHRDLMVAVANQGAIALQNAQLFIQTQEALAETEALLTIASTASSSFDINETLSKVLNQVLDSIGSQAGMISVVNPQTKTLELFAYRLPRQMSSDALNIGLDNMLCGLVYRQGKPVVIENLREDPKVEAQAAIEEGFMSYQGVPLEAKGKILGTLSTYSTKSLSPRTNDLHILQAIGRQIGVTIENATLFEQTQEQAAELEILNEMSRTLSTLFDIDKIFDTIYKYSSKLMDTSSFYIALYSKEEGNFSYPFIVDDDKKISGNSSDVLNHITQHIIDTRQPLIISEKIKETIQVLGIVKNEVEIPIQSLLGVPLIIGDDVLGVIIIYNSERPFIFNHHDQELLVSIARQSAIAIQTAELFEETRKRVRDLTTLTKASQTLASAPLELNEVANIIKDQINDVVPIDTSINISLRDVSNPRTLRKIVSTKFDPELGIFSEDDQNSESFSYHDHPLIEEVMTLQKSMVIHKNDLHENNQSFNKLIDRNAGTVLILPLVLKGEAIGLIELETFKDEYYYTDEEISLLSTLANQAAISLENARLYDEQLRATEQLRELDQLKSQFLANISHELRTPFNSIIGFSRVIMKGIDGPVTDLQKQDLSAIYNAGQHLLKMINDILDISKIDAGKMELSFEEVNILDVIDSVISTARGLIKDKPIELFTVLDKDLPNIYADPTRIRQILLNLLSNAAKFTDRGSITVTANQHLRKDGQPEVYISVKDTGVGIPMEKQDNLFEPFVQVDGSPTRSTGGTGLGLSITKMLVDLHKGNIGLESEIGKGSNFFFTLPINPSVSFRISNEQLTVLAIDPDNHVTQLYESYLRETPYKLIPLTDPAMALIYTKEMKPNIITLDIQLPGNDGWRIFEKIKNDPLTSEIPIVICSLIDEKEKGNEMGVDGYLVKPILAEDFIETITSLTGKGNRY